MWKTVLVLFIATITATSSFVETSSLMDVTKTGNGERGAGSGERGTEVWERVVSGNLHKNPKWPVMAGKDQEPGKIDDREASKQRLRSLFY